MRDILDIHAHTIVSGHAYNTIKEMAEAASKRGLEILGLTEHAPSMRGSCSDMYFGNLKVVDRFAYYGIELLLGVELNILDAKGTVDLGADLLEYMDVTIASFHPPCIESMGQRENTNAVIGVIENPYVDIVGHLDDSRYPVDYNEIAQAARENGKLLELNNASLLPTSFRKNGKENYVEMLRCCMKYGTSIVINSDAHVDHLVGKHEEAMAILAEMKFPEELVINTSVDKMKKYVSKYKR